MNQLAALCKTKASTIGLTQSSASTIMGLEFIMIGVWLSSRWPPAP